MPTSNIFVRLVYKHLWLIQLGVDMVLLNSFYYGLILKPFYSEQSTPSFTNSSLFILGILNISWIIFFFWYRIHRVERRSNNLQHYLEGLLQAIMLFGLVALILWGIAYKPGGQTPTFMSFLYYYILSILLWRLTVYWTVTYSRLLGYNSRSVAILGYGKEGHAIEKYLKANPQLGYRLKGYFDDKKTGHHLLLGNLKDFKAAIARGDIQVVYCCLAQSETNLSDILALAHQYFIQVYVVPQMTDYPYIDMQVNSYEGLSVLGLKEGPLDRPLNRLLKRSFDVCLSLVVVLFILSWMTLLIGFIIRIQSPGPIFYTQRRQGLRRRAFMCFKFRTMYWDGGYYGNILPQQTTKDDVRVTPIGRFLRRTSLDEFPQFLNVLLGDMSIVGPRPHPHEMDEAYSREHKLNNLWGRLRVKPGVTGLAQSRGYRGEIKDKHEMEGRIRLDSFYIHNWSFLLDIRIILSTMYVLLKDPKAY